MDPITWYTSISGIVAFTIIIVEILKRVLATNATFAKVPTWLYAVAVSIVLTEVAHAVLKTLPGDDFALICQAVYYAAIASGVKEWFSNAGKPLGASSAAISVREDKS